jgi:hypothetical protein
MKTLTLYINPEHQTGHVQRWLTAHNAIGQPPDDGVLVYTLGIGGPLIKVAIEATASPMLYTSMADALLDRIFDWSPEQIEAFADAYGQLFEIEVNKTIIWVACYPLNLDQNELRLDLPRQ